MKKKYKIIVNITTRWIFNGTNYKLTRKFQKIYSNYLINSYKIYVV